MYRMILVMIAALTITTAAQAKNYVYRNETSSLESEGYKLFIGDGIINTVEKMDPSADSSTFCAGADENTASHIGDVNAVRRDDRLMIDAKAKISYSAACRTYYSVLAHLKTADDVRKLWLLFGDSVTDEYAVKTIKEHGAGEDAGVLIEMKRLSTVSKYLEFFYTKNKEWKLTDYAFLSQAFKARKGKPLSPTFSAFITALLTGDNEGALRIVRSVDLDNLGNRFMTQEPTMSVKARGAGNNH